MEIRKLRQLFHLLIATIAFAGCGPSTVQIGETVKASMQQTFNSDPQFKNLRLTAESVIVMKASGNTYQGIATVRSDDQSHDIPVKITADGKNVMWQTEPGAFLSFSPVNMQRSLATIPGLTTEQQLEPTTDKAIRLTQQMFRFRDDQPEGARHGTWTASALPLTSNSRFVLVHYSVPERNLKCEWMLGFPLTDPHIYSVDKADECVRQVFQYASSYSFGLDGQPALSCQEQFAGIRDYYKELITRTYGSNPALVVTPSGNDTSSLSYGCVAIFQFQRGSFSHVAKWIMFPNQHQDEIVAVTSDACELDSRRALTENKWAQDPCMPQFASDVNDLSYGIKVAEAVSSGRSRCESALASDMKGHAQSVATLYHVIVSPDLSVAGDPATENFTCSVVDHVPQFNGSSSPDRIARWLLYPNRTVRRLVAANSFACDVEAKMAAAHSEEAEVPCEDGQPSTR